jgi:pimeloyl-ACP methyl ester carboxylesterase
VVAEGAADEGGGVTTAAGVREEVVPVGGGRLELHVKVAGDGPPVVFFHPLPGLEWQPMLDALAESHTVYAPEHPGTSPGDHTAIRQVDTFFELLLLYEEAVRALGLERPAAVGQSFGGMVAADLAATFPDLFSRLVVMAPIGIWRDATPIRLVQMLTGPAEETPQYLFAHPESPEAQAMVALPEDPEQIPKAIAQSVWNIGCTSKFCWPIADHGLERRLHRIAVPTLVVWGREDALVPAAYAEEFGSRIPGARVELLDDCGHVPQADQPERTNELLAEFLAAQ